jgi:hypothetical protein
MMEREDFEKWWKHMKWGDYMKPADRNELKAACMSAWYTAIKNKKIKSTKRGDYPPQKAKEALEGGK